MAFRSIGSDRTDIAFEGSQGIPGAFEDNNSFRGEAAGLLEIIVTVNFLCTLHNVQHGGICSRTYGACSGVAPFVSGMLPDAIVVVV